MLHRSRWDRHQTSESGARAPIRIATAPLALSVALLFAPAAAARVASYPYHATNNVECGITSAGRTVTAHSPGGHQMTSRYNRQKVYWRSRLYRFNSQARSWQPWNNSKPWLWAIAGHDGLRVWQYSGGITNFWFNTQNNNILEQHIYIGLAPGSYSVYEYFKWGNSRPVGRWAREYNALNASYCSF